MLWRSVAHQISHNSYDDDDDNDDDDSDGDNDGGDDGAVNGCSTFPLSTGRVITINSAAQQRVLFCAHGNAGYRQINT